MASLGEGQERSQRDGGERACARLAAGADEDEIGGGVKPDVVGVAANIHPWAFGVGAAVEGTAGAVATATSEKPILSGEEKEALGLIDVSQAVNAAPFGEVHYLNGVVFQGGDEEFARGDVNSEVVEAAFDALERDRAEDGERARLLGGGGKAGRGQEHGQSGARLNVSESLCRHGWRIAADWDLVVTPKGYVGYWAMCEEGVTKRSK